jgi:DNA-binding transcriptional MerR regulator
MDKSWKQVCDSAKISSSKGAFYRDKYDKYFAFTFTGVGRNRRYSLEATELIILILDLYNKGFTSAQIESALEDKHGVPADIIIQDNNTTTSQQDVIESIRLMFREEISKLEDKIDMLSSQNKARDDETYNRDRILMEVLKNQLELKQQARKSWWTRLFGIKN